MLYIGNFSYNDDTDSADNYCLMPCVVEAENADEALEKFAEHFHEVRKSTDLLEGAHEIFLDSLAELEGVPSEPVICQWQKIVPAMDGLCSITSALPVSGANVDYASAYGLDLGDEHDHDCGCDHNHECDCDHDHDHDDFDEEEDGVLEEPFLRF